MGQNEFRIFLVAISALIIIFIAGIAVFIVQYRKRRLEYENEKLVMNELHTRELLTTQLESQLITMQHIGKEIHDNVGQKLTLASLYSKQVLLDNGKSVEEKIASVSAIIDESLTELRQLSKNLTASETGNIVQLLNDEAVKIKASGVCTLNISSNEDIKLRQAEKNILFRLLQEFIQNSLKHAGNCRININFEKEGNLLNIKAEDNGKGFDTKAVYGGIGLQNMKRRAEEIGAAFQLESLPGKGTTLILQLKLEA